MSDVSFRNHYPENPVFMRILTAGGASVGASGLGGLNHVKNSARTDPIGNTCFFITPYPGSSLAYPPRFCLN